MHQLPIYQCHKRVRAVRIAAVEINEDGSAKIAPARDGIASFTTQPDWSSRFRGGEIDLGYFVQYEDGYESWSPTGPFENGYSRI